MYDSLAQYDSLVHLHSLTDPHHSFTNPYYEPPSLITDPHHSMTDPHH